MDFYAMKRKKLQSFCKKHGIPANLKNVEMARQLSLIYKGEENTNHVSRKLRSDKTKKPVEIIILDSDSDTDIQIEVSGVAAEKDSIEKNNVRAEHLLDEVADQCVVQSDLIIHQDVDSDTVAEKDCNEKTSVSAELDGVKSDHKFDNYHIKDNQDLSPATLSDLNVEADEGADKDKLNVEVIDLDSDSGADHVQMEALDTIAENDSNEKTNLSDEHKLEAEPDQFCEVTSDHKVDSGSAVGNADACEVNSASSQKTSHGREESMFKSQPEGDDIGSLHVKKSMHMSVEKEQNEENQELDPAAAGEDENMVEEEVEVLIEKSDVHEDSSGTEKVGDEAEKLDEKPKQILITPLSEVKSDHNVDSDTVAEKDSNEKTSVSAELDGVKSDRKFDNDQIEDNQDLSPATPSDLNVRHIVDSVTVAGNDSNEKTNLGAENLPAEEPDQFQATCPPSEAKSDLNIHDMIDSDACEVKSASSQKMGRGEESQMKSPPSEGGNVFEQFGNYMMMGEFEMSSEYTDVHQRSITENVNLLYVSPMEYSDYSVDQVHKSNDNNCVISSGGNATTCLDTSSGAKGSLSEVETSDLDAHEMVFTGTATISGAKFESSRKMRISPASGEIIGSSTKLLINSVTPRNIGFCDVEGSSQIGGNKEQVDDVQMEASVTVADHLQDEEPDQFLTSSPSEVKSDHKVDSAPSEDENLVGREVEVLSEKTNVQEYTSETKKVEAAKIDQISNHQGKTMENVNDEGTSPRLVEHVPDLDYNNCVQVEAAAMCFDASTCAKNTDENTDEPVEDNLDEVCSSGFEDSDGTPLQVLPTDPIKEVETSDLGHHEMVVTGTATTNADTSGVKFECSPKVNVSPVSEKVIGSSTKLTNNTVTPKEIGFIYVEKSMQIGVDEEQVYHSEVKKNDNSTNVTVENIQIGFFDLEENMQVGGDEEQVYHSEVKKNDDNTNVTVESRPIGFFDVGEYMEIGVDEEQIDHSEVKTIDDHDNVAVENMQIGVAEESVDHSEVKKTEDNAIVTVENMQIGVDEEQVDHSEVKKIEDNAIVTVENMQIGVDEEQVYHSEVKKNDKNTNVTVENRQIGFYDVGENMEVCVDEGQIDHSEVKTIDDNDNVAVENMQIGVAEEQVDHSEVKKIEDNALVTIENMQVGVDEEHVDHSEVKKIEDNAIVTVENMQIGVDEEQVDHSEVKKVDDNAIVTVENMQIGVDEEHVDQNEVKKIDDNANVTIEDILNDVHSSSFRDSDGRPVQVTDPTSEVETADLDAHKMVVKGIATTKNNACTSGSNSESSQKMSVSPASREMIGSPTNLLNISVTPKDIGFSDGEENMRIGVNEEEVDHSQVKNTDENTDVAFEDILDEVRLCNFEDSDGIPAQFLPTEVRTSDLDVQEMVVTGTASKISFTSGRGVKFESLQKKNTSPASEKTSGSSTRLLNNPVTPRDIDFCDGEENMPIGVDEEQVDPSEVKKIDENTMAVDSDVCDVKSASLQKISRGREDSEMKLAHEKVDAGTFYEEENMQKSGNKEKNEDNQELHPAAPSEDEKVVDGEVEIVEDILDEFHSSSFEDSNGTPVQVLPTDPSNQVETSELDVHEMVVTGTANNIVTPKEIGFIDVDKNMQIGVDEEHVDYNEVKKRDDKVKVTVETMETGVDEEQVDHREVEKIDANVNVAVENMQIGVAEEQIDHSEVKKIEDNTIVTVEDMQIDVDEEHDNDNVTVEDILNDVHSSSFGDSDRTTVQVLPTDPLSEEETSDLDVHPMAIDSSLIKCRSLPYSGIAAGHVDACEVKSAYSQKTSRASGEMIGSPANLLNISVTPNDIRFSDGEENMRTGVVEEEVDHSQVKKIDENINMTVEGDTENLDQISNHEESIMKDVNPLHVSPKESSGCSVEEVHKLDDNNCVVDAVAVMSDEQVLKSDESNCVMEEASAMGFDASTGAKNTNENTDVAFDDILEELRLSSFEDSDGTPAQFLPTDQSTKMETNDLDAQEIVAADACEEEMLRSSEKTCMVADPVECIAFSPNDFEGSTNKSFEVEPFFDPNKLGDLETCNMNESMQIDDVIEKENNQGEGRHFFENCDVHDDVGGVGAEDENQPSETASRKKKRSDANSDEEVKDELVPTSEIDPSNFSLHQLFASETASGDEDAYHKKLDSPSKATPMIHKENIKFDKKEEVGSVMSIGVVAEKDSNEKTSVSAELDGVKSDHKFDNFQIEDNQDLSQATPSDLNVEADEGADKDKLNVEVIDLNSNSGVDDVQMEGLDTVARNDSNVKTNLNVDTVAGNGSNEKTNLSDEHKPEEEPDQLSEVKSDNKVESGSVVGNADACEVSSASLQKTSHGQEVFKFKSQPEGDEEVKDELVPTSEMDSSNFCLHQLFASETASGDEDAYPKKLDSPSKATPMIHKENIRFDKKEEVGSVMSRNKFAKRQPLQDLKQN